jgi:uncharacterized protein YjiK
MKISKKSFILIFAAFIFVNFACRRAAKDFSSPAEYDLGHPDKFLMPDELLEISGIAFHNLNPDLVYSIQDEDGRVFSQKWGVKKPVVCKFGSKGDYEDVAIMKDQIFVLKSNGSIYSFPITESTNEKAADVREWKKTLPKGEYEGLYADESSSKLYVLCKNCEIDKKKAQATGYILDYDPASRAVVSNGTFSINTKEIDALGEKVGAGLRASAISRNPVSKAWYVLSSVNKMLVVLDQSWAVKSVHRLDSGVFNQPEGLAFDRAQNLYISNEGDEITNGNILRFRYNTAHK